MPLARFEISGRDQRSCTCISAWRVSKVRYGVKAKDSFRACSACLHTVLITMKRGILFYSYLGSMEPATAAVHDGTKPSLREAELFSFQTVHQVQLEQDQILKHGLKIQHRGPILVVNIHIYAYPDIPTYNGGHRCIFVLVIAHELSSSSSIILSSRQPCQYSPNSPQCRDAIVLVEEVKPFASLQLQFVFKSSGVSIACQALQIFVVDA